MSATGVKYDTGKPRLRLLFHDMSKQLTRVAEVLEYGANKYTENGWQTVPDAAKRYEDAMERHLAAWRQGQSRDQESGLHHLQHAACNLLFLLYFYEDEINAKSSVYPQ